MNHWGIAGDGSCCLQRIEIELRLDFSLFYQNLLDILQCPKIYDDNVQVYSKADYLNNTNYLLSIVINDIKAGQKRPYGALC